MRSARAWLWFLCSSCSVFLVGCPAQPDTVSVGDAQAALEASAQSSQTDALLSDAVEISTHFSVGTALESAAVELQTFIASQLPCAAISVSGATLSIAYGALPGACSYQGHSFSGEHTVSVLRNAANEVAVHHEWNELSDGRVSISGSADVVWSRSTQSRHVTHEISYQVLSGRYVGQSGTGSGDRTQTALTAAGDSGMRVEGTRSWDTAHGHFDLDISGIEMRWIDPVPQAGRYTLTTPNGNTLDLAFHRSDADSIDVSITTAKRTFAFLVRSDGNITP
jgi:hypothetical protein